jgi:hypothetical protein
VQVVAEVGGAREPREPYEDILACAYGQGREGVLGVLGLEARQGRRSGLGQHRAHPAVEEVVAAGKPERAVAGRSSSTSSESIIVALAWLPCAFQTGPP